MGNVDDDRPALNKGVAVGTEVYRLVVFLFSIGRSFNYSLEISGYKNIYTRFDFVFAQRIQLWSTHPPIHNTDSCKGFVARSLAYIYVHKYDAG